MSVCSAQNPINTDPAEDKDLTSEHGHVTVKQTCKCHSYTHTLSGLYSLFLLLNSGMVISYFHTTVDERHCV